MQRRRLSLSPEDERPAAALGKLRSRGFNARRLTGFSRTRHCPSDPRPPRMRGGMVDPPSRHTNLRTRVLHQAARGRVEVVRTAHHVGLGGRRDRELAEARVDLGADAGREPAERVGRAPVPHEVPELRHRAHGRLVGVSEAREFGEPRLDARGEYRDGGGAQPLVGRGGLGARPLRLLGEPGQRCAGALGERARVVRGPRRARGAVQQVRTRARPLGAAGGGPVPRGDPRGVLRRVRLAVGALPALASSSRQPRT